MIYPEIYPGEIIGLQIEHFKQMEMSLVNMICITAGPVELVALNFLPDQT